MTGCTCDTPGFCERHQVKKNAHWHLLCKTNDRYFHAWEHGHGPGQVKFSDPPPTRGAACSGKGPPLATRAWNLAAALVAFAADGFHLVETAEYERRLSICDGCEMRQGSACALCGCNLAAKARGRAFRCPVGRWATSIERRWSAPMVSELDRQWAEAYMAGDNDPEYARPAPWRYVRTSELAAATVAMLPKIPRDVAGVAGIPRSGMLPAAILASHLHVPLFECTRTSGLRGLTYGIRGNGFKRDDIAHGPLLVVDDTIYSGFAMRSARNAIANRKAYYAAVFARPSKASEADFCAEILPSPHLLEWNLWSSGMTCGAAANPGFRGGLATDLDGVLCEDFLRDGDDTPEGDERYRRDLIHARPLVTAGLYPIPLIVTYRLERFRAETEDWLRRNRILYDKLVMHQAERFRDRDFATPTLKIDAYAASSCSLFVESDSAQALAIRQATGRPVLDMATGVIL